MTEDERKALELIEGGVELLRNAIVRGYLQRDRRSPSVSLRK